MIKQLGLQLRQPKLLWVWDTLGNLVTFFYKATWNQEQFLLPLQLPLRRKKDYPCALRASKNFYSSNQFASQSEFLFQHPVRCFQGKGAVIGLNKPFRLHNAILPPFTHTGEVILNMADTEESFKSQQANVIQTFFSLVVMRFLAISANCRGSLQTVLKIFWTKNMIWANAMVPHTYII